MANIVVDTSEGFVDLKLPILKVELAENGEAFFHVGGEISQAFLGCHIHLAAGMRANDLLDSDRQVNAYPDGVSITLTDDAGRRFAKKICELYGENREVPPMPMMLKFLAVALDGEPSNIANEAVKFKLFHEENSPEDDEGPDYFEMYLNVHILAGFVELNEKDHDFRDGILTAFSA